MLDTEDKEGTKQIKITSLNEAYETYILVSGYACTGAHAHTRYRFNNPTSPKHLAVTEWYVHSNETRADDRRVECVCYVCTRMSLAMLPKLLTFIVMNLK